MIDTADVMLAKAGKSLFENADTSAARRRTLKMVNVSYHIAAIHLLSTLSTTAAFTFPTQHIGYSTALQSRGTDADVIDDRRSFLVSSFAGALTAATVIAVPNHASAADLPGLLSDLPPEAARSYLQYRIPLQISADYYLWDLQEKIADTDEWGYIGELFQVNNNKGQGQPNKIERDFTNPMRILALSMPPDIADELRDAQFKFERSMQGITKATKGVRRDLPVELDPADLKLAKQSWEGGRVALNEFFVVLNNAVGLEELKTIPAAGPNQSKDYGRSQRRFNDLQKKTKLCQNRGGPTLSQAWGGLMVSGYLQDSCGIPDLEEYFRQ